MFQYDQHGYRHSVASTERNRTPKSDGQHAIAADRPVPGRDGLCLRDRSCARALAWRAIAARLELSLGRNETHIALPRRSRIFRISRWRVDIYGPGSRRLSGILYQSL